MDALSLNNYKQGKIKLDIILTNRCNLQCSACMFSTNTNTNRIPKSEYDFEQYKWVPHTVKQIRKEDYIL